MVVVTPHDRLAGMDINGASAIVTGGASGIGAASARRLAARGAKVVIADLKADDGQALADEIGGAFVPVDVTDTDQIIAAIDWCQSDEFWRANILSLPKLREKYDALRLQAQRGSGNTKQQQTDDLFARAMARATANEGNR